jgi:type IV fimbrial biogenesis protein FimT
MKLKTERGFTIIEIMVTIAIFAIALAFAVPSFKGALEQSRFTAAGNELISAFNYARNEAVRRARPVSVQAAVGGWQNGWTAYIDPDRDGIMAAPADLLRAGNPFVGVDAVTAPLFVSFDSTGRRVRPTGATTEIAIFKAGAASTQSRMVCVQNSGRTSVVKGVLSCVNA